MAAVPIDKVPIISDNGERDLTVGQATNIAEQKEHQPLGGDVSSFSKVRLIDVLRSKAKYGNMCHSVKASETVAAALEIMNRYHIGAILVTNGDNGVSGNNTKVDASSTIMTDPSDIVGLFTTRDFIKKLNESDTFSVVDPRLTPVSDMMLRNPAFVYHDETALRTLHLMNAGIFRHVLVRDRLTNHTIGLVSIGDCVRIILRLTEEKVTFLEELVAGKYSMMPNNSAPNDGVTQA